MYRLRETLCFAMMLLFMLVPAIAGCTVNTPESLPPVKNKIEVAVAPQPEQASPKHHSSGQTQSTLPTLPMAIPSAEASTENKDKSEQKNVYLTFDDGPNTQYTVQVLDILDNYQVKATFMVVGRNVQLNPQLVNQIIDRGHGIVNHTYSHDYNIIYKSPDALIADLNRNEELLKPLVGNVGKIFRAPGGPGKLDKNFMSRLEGEGYKSVGWNISGVDSDPAGVTPEQVYNNVAADLARVERLKLTPIILLHDGTQLYTTEARPGSPLARYIQNRESVIAALPRIIDLFKEKGYAFTLVDENTPPAW